MACNGNRSFVRGRDRDPALPKCSGRRERGRRPFHPLNGDAPRATDVLANERTFLAYLRTALTFVAFGFVVARFALFEREIALVTHTQFSSHGVSAIFGTAVALFGAAIAAYGGYRYASAARAFITGRSAALPTVAAVVIGTIVTVIGAAVAIDLVAIR